jgi:serine/threonine protein kinase
MAIDPLELVGVTLDEKFRVDSFIGDEGSYFTYRGHDIRSEAPVLVRCLQLRATVDPALAARYVESFHERARLQERLGPGSPSFVRVLGSGGSFTRKSGQSVPYEVREWLEATTLGAYQAKRRSERSASSPEAEVSTGAWSLDEVLRLLDPVAEGLAYAHDVGVTHAELHPNSLLVVKVEGRPTAKIVDFGEVRQKEEKATDRPELRVLVPEYAAPEQIDGQLGAVGPRTDVYALAVIVLECLAGTLAMKDVPASAAVDPNRRPSPKRLGLTLPPRVNEVVERALSLVPNRRQRDVATFWRELKAAVSEPAATPAKELPEAKGPGASPNPFAMHTLFGVQPMSPPLPPSREGEAAPASPTVPLLREVDGLAPQPGHASSEVDAAPSLRAALPLEDVKGAPAVEEDPVLFLPALGGPSSAMRLRALAAWIREVSGVAYTRSNRWIRDRAWPWLLAKAKDDAPRSRALLGASVLGGCVLLVLGVRLCAGSRSPRPSDSTMAPSAARSAPSPPVEAPFASAVAPDAGGTIELAEEAPSPARPPARAVAPLPAPAAPAATAIAASFTRSAAVAALEAAGSDLSSCRRQAGLSGAGSIRATFGKTGAVMRITIGPPYADTPQGACILNRFGGAQMEPFRGAPGSVNYTFHMPK